MTLDSISLTSQQSCPIEMDGGSKSSGSKLDTRRDDDDDD